MYDMTGSVTSQQNETYSGRVNFLDELFPVKIKDYAKDTVIRLKVQQVKLINLVNRRKKSMDTITYASVCGPYGRYHYWNVLALKGDIGIYSREWDFTMSTDALPDRRYQIFLSITTGDQVLSVPRQNIRPLGKASKWMAKVLNTPKINYNDCSCIIEPSRQSELAIDIISTYDAIDTDKEIKNGMLKFINKRYDVNFSIKDFKDQQSMVDYIIAKEYERELSKRNRTQS